MIEGSLKDRFREAMALHRAGSIDEAVAIYRDLLRKAPEHAGAWHLLGVALHSRHRLADALGHIQKALSLCDSKATYWNNCGAVQKDLGLLPEAEKSIRKAISINPNYSDAWSNLGLLQLEAGNLEAAEQSIRYALRLEPRHADALGHLAVIYRERGEFEESLRLCRDALAVSPAMAEVHAVESGILTMLKRFDEAAASGDRALSCNPRSANPYISRGYLHYIADELEEARRLYGHAAKLQPSRPMCRLRHLGLCPTVFFNKDDIEEYRSELERQLDEALSDAPSLDWRCALTDAFMPPFELAHHGLCNRTLKEKYARLFSPHFPKMRPDRKQGGKIRVGFLCTVGHEGGYVRSYGEIMRRLDRSKFEVFGLVSKSIVSYCRKRIPAEGIQWVGIAHDLSPAYETIRRTRCDIVAHRHADTDKTNYFLPFLPLAPVQVVGSGMHGTTGIANIDFGISSRLFERGDEATQDYTEKLVQFSRPLLWQRRPVIQGTPTRDDFGLPGTGALYFCPQRLAKILPEFDAILRQILDRDPTGHVLILEGGHAAIAERLRARLRMHLGEQLAKRILFLPSQPIGDYLRLLSLATAVLDTPNYSTALTGYDSFGLGIPVVTLPGKYMLQRYALGFYRQMGLLDLVAADETQYVELAVRLGRDAEFRNAMHSEILRRSDVLFQNDSVVSEYETFFEEALQSHS